MPVARVPVARPAIIRAGIGVAVSLLAIAIVVSQADPARTADVLSRAAPGWIALTAGFVVLDLVARVVRWRRLLAPIRHVPFGATLAYLLIGYLANNLLPVRLGEFVRSHYMGDRQGISRATTLGTIVVERVVDLAVVVSIAAVAILVLSVRGAIANAVLIGGAIGALLVLALALGIVAHRLPGAGRVAAAVARWPRVGVLARSLQEGLAVAGRPRTLAEALALTVAAWAATLVAFAAAGQAVGVQMTTGQAALLASGVALASAIPAGPGSLGTFELAAVNIATSYGIESEAAFAIAILVHAVILIVTSVGGAVALTRVGFGHELPAAVADAPRPAIASPGSPAEGDFDR